MARRYLEILFTPAVRAAQRLYQGREMAPPLSGAPVGEDPLGREEAEFIRGRDSFYLASLSPSGWPYLQHRGGEPGFLHVLGPGRLGFADYKGNRQMLTAGHVSVDDRVSLFLMDYPGRRRLKILGRMRVVTPAEDPGLFDILTKDRNRGVTERLFVVDVISFDWNCPKYIKPRFTSEEVEEVLGPMRARIRELETALRARDPRSPSGTEPA